jgi:branched-chain amino acid transport system ATP-binding protein
MLSVRNLYVAYGVVPAVVDLDLEVGQGQAVALLGANGAGKSTTARAISGLVRPRKGQVTFDGVDTTRQSPEALRRHGICYLPEGRGIFAGLTVQENLRMAASSLPRAARGARISHAEDKFPILGQRRHQRAGSLSGGEQQMLSLARVTVHPPKLIIADEPSLGLAPKLVDAVFETLETFRRDGISILLIEQFIHRSLSFADFCVLLHRGRLGWSGRPAEAHAEVLSRYLGGN